MYPLNKVSLINPVLILLIVSLIHSDKKHRQKNLTFVRL